MCATLADLLAHGDQKSTVRCFGSTDTPVEKMVISAEQAAPGTLFVCLEADPAQAARITSEAVSRGCTAVLSSHHLPFDTTITQLQAPNPGPVVGRMAAHLHGNPSRALHVIAVTGTNGKTTTTFFCKAILEAAGHRIGLIGTNVYDLGTELLEPWKTTPAAPELHSLMARMVSAGLDAMALEASSSGLMMDRLIGTEVDVAIFTNLTLDHMDHHFTMDGYFEAKSRLFYDPEQSVHPRWAIINADDAWGRRLLEMPEVQSKKIRIGVNEPADVRAEGIEPLDPGDLARGSRFRLVSPWGAFDVSFPVFGRHNIYNALCAFTAAVCLGVEPPNAALALAGLRLPAGRLQEVPSNRGFRVFVDYAHDLGALQNVTDALRSITRGRLILLFGCNGRRGRVPADIGRLAAAQSDFCIVTSDNPREASPSRMIEEVVSAFPPGTEFRAVQDRREAIGIAIAMARPGDVVLLAGKGHETVQVIGNKSIPHNDRQVAAEALSRH